MSLRDRIEALGLAPDGRPRPAAPFGRGPVAARALRTAIRAAYETVGRLPVGVAAPLARAGGLAEWALRAEKRRQLAENLAHALALPPDHPDVAALVRREVQNEAGRSADLLWALAHPDELVATTTISGAEWLDDALAPGRGMLLATTHVGGWEVATALARPLVPVPTTAIVTDDWIAWAVDGLRRQAGLGIMYDSEPVSKAARLLRSGEAVLVLGDYAKPGMRTYAVRFLDAVAELPAGTATLARLCRTPVVPFSVLPLGRRRWHVAIEAPIAPPAREHGEAGERALLQALADRWSATLRAHAEHWAAVYPIVWHPT